MWQVSYNPFGLRPVNWEEITETKLREFLREYFAIDDEETEAILDEMRNGYDTPTIKATYRWVEEGSDG